MSSKRKAQEVKVNDIRIGQDQPVVLIAGPCVIESDESALFHAKEIKRIAKRVGIPFIFKSSYDKANRTSLNSFRGPGIKEGLKVLKRIKQKLNIPIISDVHCRAEVEVASEVLDIIQIPAFLCRQTDLVIEAAKTGKVLNIKKGQFLAPWDVIHIIKKVESTGNRNILITERGTSFGYNNLVCDFRSLKFMRDFGYPVVFDASHSLQLPGGRGSSSDGLREFIPEFSLSAVVFGCDGLFIEVHKNPNKALCDGPNMLILNQLEVLLRKVKKIDKLLRCP